MTGWLTAFSFRFRFGTIKFYCIQLVTSPIHRAKLEYHTSQIADASGDQKKLFKIVAKLLHTDHDTPLPTCDSFDALAEQFSDFVSE